MGAIVPDRIGATTSSRDSQARASEHYNPFPSAPLRMREDYSRRARRWATNVRECLPAI
ncbi:MAG: hypothetical protein ACLQMF_16595 [Rectinemataceae bacterium]